MGDSPEAFPGAACQLHVSNIPFEMGEGALATIFAGVPGIVQAQTVVDKDTGKSKGFGFIRFDNARDADAAIARFDNLLVNNRNLKVKRAHREWRDRGAQRQHDLDGGPPQGSGGPVRGVDAAPRREAYREREAYDDRGRHRDRSPAPYDGDDRYQPGGSGRGHRSRSRERYPPVGAGDRDREYGREGGDRGRGPPPGRWEDRAGNGSSPPHLRDPGNTSGGRLPPGGGGGPYLREARESTPPHRGPMKGVPPGLIHGSTRHGPPPPSQRMDPYGLETYSHAGAQGHRHTGEGVHPSDRYAAVEPGYAPYRGSERGGYGGPYEEPVAVSRGAGGGYPPARDAHYPDDGRVHYPPHGAPRRQLSPDGVAPAYYEPSGPVAVKAAPAGYGGRGGAPYDGERSNHGAAAAEPGYRGAYAPRGGSSGGGYHNR